MWPQPSNYVWFLAFWIHYVQQVATWLVTSVSYHVYPFMTPLLLFTWALWALFLSPWSDEPLNKIDPKTITIILCYTEICSWSSSLLPFSISYPFLLQYWWRDVVHSHSLLESSTFDSPFVISNLLAYVVQPMAHIVNNMLMWLSYNRPLHLWIRTQLRDSLLHVCYVWGLSWVGSGWLKRVLGIDTLLFTSCVVQ